MTLASLCCHGKWHMALLQQAILTWWCWKRWSIFLRTGNLLATSFFVRRHTARRITPLGCASWSEDAVLMRGRLRRSMSRAPQREGTMLVLSGSVSHIARSRGRARQREGWCRRTPRGADELGDSVQPVLVEVVDRAVAQELACHEQRGLCVRGGAASVRR